MAQILSPMSLNKRQKALVQDLIDRSFPPKAWGREEDLHALWEAAQDLGRDLALTLDRRGQVQGIRIESQRGETFFTPPGHPGTKGLLGVRVLATDLQGRPEGRDQDRQALAHWHYDSLGVLYGAKDRPRLRTYLLQADSEGFLEDLQEKEDLDLALGEDRTMGQAIQNLEKTLEARLRETDFRQERAVLVFMTQEGEDLEVLQAELKALAQAAGVDVVGMVNQASRANRKKLGAGKVQDVVHMVRAQEAQVVIFNDLLSPALHRDMSQAMGVKVLDKAALILDIFALRARSREGKLQVELAQLNYRLPHLTGKGLDLSRLGGGVGTRGPGETKLETDRRHIRRRMTKIREELEEVGQDRAIQRRARDQSGALRVALVGYTNAGKSSLLNALAGSDLYAEDQVFATLDAATRLVPLASGDQVLMSDTVGFIRDLPPELLDAFKSTLEELHYVDVLFHVVDAATPDIEDRMAIVEETLENLGLEEKETLLILNKCDAAPDLPLLSPDRGPRDWLAVSAHTGQGLDDIRAYLQDLLRVRDKEAHLFLPYAQSETGKILAQVHDHARILQKDYAQEGVSLTLALAGDDPLWADLRPYITDR